MPSIEAFQEMFLLDELDHEGYIALSEKTEFLTVQESAKRWDNHLLTTLKATQKTLQYAPTFILTYRGAWLLRDAFFGIITSISWTVLVAAVGVIIGAIIV